MARRTKKPSGTTTRTATKQMRLRALITVGLLGLCAVAILVRLVQLQVVEADDWLKRAVSQQLSDTTVPAKRGTIYAANMEPLAESAEVWKIIMSPKDIGELNWKKLDGADTTQTLTDEQALELLRGRIADGLAGIFGLDREAMYKKTCRTNSQYEVIKSKVEYDKKTEFTEWLKKNGLSGAFYIATDYKRYYPQGSLASTVLGFTGTDYQGLDGLESKYEQVLAGTPGRLVTAQNGLGKRMPITMEYTKEVGAVDGYSLVLTIDPTVQMYAEKYLADAVASAECTNRGVAIVMNVKTGAVLAMATKGDYDPNEPFTVADPTAATAIAALSGDEKNSALRTAQTLQWKN